MAGAGARPEGEEWPTKRALGEHGQVTKVPGQMARPGSGAPESQLGLQGTKGCGREGRGYDSGHCSGLPPGTPSPTPSVPGSASLPVGWRQVYLLPGQAPGKAPQQTWERSRGLWQLLG